MTTTDKSTPLWLELRKEYIDDNFEKLITYLRDVSDKTNDSFYQTTLNLLHDRVTDLVQKLSFKPLYQDIDSKEATTYNIRLLAAYLLTEENSPLSLSAYVAMMNELKQLTPKFADKITQKTLERLKYDSIKNLGYTWNDIIDFKIEIFAYYVTKNSVLGNLLTKPLCYENYGTAYLSAKGLYLTPEKKKDAKKLLNAGTNSLDTQLGVTLRTSSNEKLKQSLERNIPAMDEYVKDFIYMIWKTKKKETKHTLKHYDGEEVTVKVTSIERNGQINVETVDDRYEKVCGHIEFYRPNILYYYSTDFHKHFKVGDYLKSVVRDVTNGIFDIEKQFVSFVVEDCRTEYGMGETPAKLLYKNSNSYVWINERGIPFYSRPSDDYQIGDYAYLQITEYRIGEQYGKIHTLINEPAPESEVGFDTDEIQRDCIVAFATTTPAPANIIKDDDQELSPSVLRLLVRMLFGHQKNLLKPSERFCFLANSRIMAEMTNDDASSSYIQFAATYLRILVQFVNNEPINTLSLEPENEFLESRETLIRLSVVKLLKEYGKKENSTVLADTIETFGDSIPMLARLARLVQTANSMQGTLSQASINVIKREIIKTLSLETENDTDLEADSGIYLGVESGTLEFKTSFVYPSGNNMQPNETEQEINVFKGICAFLNSTTGGTLYIGVNDSGYVSGIENDLRFLRMESIDAYIRHIQDRAKHFFDTDGIVYLRIEPLYDNRVVAIHVNPHPYRVVELNGIAYLRVNAESRIMPENVKLELISRKVFKDKNKAAAISQLQHACSQSKVVILHNYSSSNSLSVKDRTVEAYDVRPDDDLVGCYDCNTPDPNKIRLFKISRIGWVEILDENWQHTSSHKTINVDAFHMSGDKPIHISLQLNLMAKNLLVEEYPAIKDDLTKDKNDESIWYLNTKVYSIYGIGRFYIGLANAIKIINAPELKEYADKFVKQYL